MTADLPVFFINLDGRPDRRAFMEGQFEALGLAARRISATRIAEIAEADIARHCDPLATLYLARSQLACTLSHIKCWRALVETGAPWGLIHEDDAILSPRLPAFLEAFVDSEIARNVDLLQLETIARRTRMLPPVAIVAGEFGIRPFRSEICGAAGYLVSAEAARRLLQRDDIFDYPTDVALFRPYMGPARDFRLALVDPALCIQANKVEATALALGNIERSALAPRPPLRTQLERLWLGAQRQYLNISDHVSYLPKGLTKGFVPFDTPEQIHKGVKVKEIGPELLD